MKPGVLDLFTDAANELVALQDGDALKALKMALAYMSGCADQNMANRSLLSGQENFITYQIKLQNTFQGVGLVWNILRRHYPEQMISGLMGLRALASMQGAVFDVPEDKASSFQDVFDHAREQGGNLDFEIEKCLSLPDLLDKDNWSGPAPGQRGGYERGAGGGYGGRAGGAGGY